MDLPRLYAIVDVDVCVSRSLAPREVARAFTAGGARLLQLRAKHLESGPFLELSRHVVQDARSRDAEVIVNDRADIARLADAAGVHVGQDDLTPAEVRRLLGDDLIVGLSTHDVAQVQEALRQPVSYLAVGPVFGTTTKETGYQAVGLPLIEAAAALAGQVPVVAIGGIDLARAHDVWRAGARSAAVITDLLAGDPQERAAAWTAAAAQTP